MNIKKVIREIYISLNILFYTLEKKSLNNKFAYTFGYILKEKAESNETDRVLILQQFLKVLQNHLSASSSHVKYNFFFFNLSSCD